MNIKRGGGGTQSVQGTALRADRPSICRSVAYRCTRCLFHCVQTGSGTHQAPTQWGLAKIFVGGKASVA